MKIQPNSDAEIHILQARYPFKLPLNSYFMGVSGTPEARQQKALIRCLMAEFPSELGLVLIPQVKTPAIPKELYTLLVVSTADFHDVNVRITEKGARVSTQMQKYKSLGYQDGQLDLAVMYPANGHHAFWCEMKHPGGHITKKGNTAKKGAASKEQRLTIIELKRHGFYACVGEGFLGALGHWLTYLGY